jgi:dTDP-4-dehydrorhamnose 3,5-epimerase-like enzyme
MKFVKDLKVATFRSNQAMGTLVAVENEKNLPIPIRRVFYIYGSSPNTLRGEHAHRECAQVLVCVNGSCEIECDDGQNKQIFTLNRGDQYLLIPPGIWASERYTRPSTVLLVFADKPYDPADYIRNYNDYLNFRNDFPNKKAA